MLKHGYTKMMTEAEWLPVALLLCLGFVLRLAALGTLPAGLNQDEASAGYDAFALLQSGVDRNGDSWPVLFVSWGSGQNVLMSYLALPFIALFGLSEVTLRLPNAICGCLTLMVFWLLARRTRGKYFGVTALFLLALNPWHIMAGRWALESNLLPFFLLLGVWLTACARADDHPWALLGAAAAFALSLYAYGAAFFFLPPFLILAVVWLRKSIRQKPLPFLLALLLFLLLAAPVAACQAINVFGLDEICFLGVTLPRLTEGRQVATSVFGGANALDNFSVFLKILWTQSDGLICNALPVRYGGVFYVFGLPTAAVGFVASLFCRKDRPGEAPMRLALVCAFLCAFLIRCNINRINMAWLPLIYFSAVGCHLILAKLDSWAALPFAAMLACFTLFCVGYRDAFSKDRGGDAGFFPGLGGAISYAQSLDAGTVYVTNRVNQPYIFALFYTQTPPETFVESVEYRDENAAFRQAERFEGFEFADPDRCAVRVLRLDEVAGDPPLKVFGDYVVCARPVIFQGES